MTPSVVKIVYEGTGGYVECGELRFEFQPIARGAYAIYFPRRKGDAKLARIKSQLETLVAAEPLKWELFEYDGVRPL